MNEDGLEEVSHQDCVGTKYRPSHILGWWALIRSTLHSLSTGDIFVVQGFRYIRSLMTTHYSVLREQQEWLAKVVIHA